LYLEFDENGIPTKDSTGKEISKKLSIKLIKD